EDGIRDRNVTGVQTCALPILFQAASQNAGVTSTPVSRAIVSRFVPIQNSEVKFESEKSAGFRITVERNSTDIGSTAPTANTVRAAPNAGMRILPRSRSRLILPFDPTVTKRLPSRSILASTSNASAPMMTITPASTAPAPVLRDWMFAYNEVASTW